VPSRPRILKKYIRVGKIVLAIFAKWWARKPAWSPGILIEMFPLFTSVPQGEWRGSPCIKERLFPSKLLFIQLSNLLPFDAKIFLKKDCTIKIKLFLCTSRSHARDE